MLSHRFFRCPSKLKKLEKIFFNFFRSFFNFVFGGKVVDASVDCTEDASVSLSHELLDDEEVEIDCVFSLSSDTLESSDSTIILAAEAAATAASSAASSKAFLRLKDLSSTLAPIPQNFWIRVLFRAAFCGKSEETIVTTSLI